MSSLSLPCSFSFPEYFDFPPFFTLQPVLSMQSKQLSMWISLLIGFIQGSIPSVPSPSQDHLSTSTKGTQRGVWKQARGTVSRLTVNATVFSNPKIGRALNRAAVQRIMKEMVAMGLAFEVGMTVENNVGTSNNISNELMRTRNECVEWVVSYRTPKEWADVIAKWAKEYHINSIYTLYELRTGIETASEEFFGLETKFVLEAVKILEQHGKAKLIMQDSEDEIGVKFIV